MKSYKLRIIKRHDLMQSVIFKAHELGYQILDPRVSLEDQINQFDYLALTKEGKIIFFNNEAEYENTPAIEITLDWFNTQKPEKMVSLIIKESEYISACTAYPEAVNWEAKYVSN